MTRFLIILAALCATAHAQNLPLLDSLSAVWRAEAAAEKTHAATLAQRYGWPVRGAGPAGAFELMRVTAEGLPVYVGTANLHAAATINTTELWPGGSSNLNLSGAGMYLGVWDAGPVRLTHVEFEGRVSQLDDAVFAQCDEWSNHPTHVSGTLVAAGLNPAAKGMAFAADLHAYDWNADQAEMAAAAKQGLLLSNHSYGEITGWYWNPHDSKLYWMGDVQVSMKKDYRFGFYSDATSKWDQTAYNAPYYLICKAAMNERTDRGPDNDTTKYWVYDPVSNRYGESSTPRDPDGPWDCMATYTVAKNILTVGAVHGLTELYTGPESVRMSDFSSWGPTDDGRIKPDVVACGVDLESSVCESDEKYDKMSGTSMATPSACGSLLLLQQLYGRLHADARMRGATLKALTIHTARECGPHPGPDYMYGWGLVDVQAAADVLQLEGENRYLLEGVLADGQEIDIRLTAQPGEALRATLVWADVPDSAHKARLDDRTPCLVNDLDLRLSGRKDMFYPWLLNPDAPDSAATQGDNIVDNVEQVLITEASGPYTLHLTHKRKLRGGRQAYSLVLTGVDSLRPSYCTGRQTFTEFSGEIADGSPDNATYGPGADCCWLIQPAGAPSLVLKFTALDTEKDHDFVRIYDGPTTDAPLLGEFSGNALPAELASTAGAVLVCFSSDAQNEGKGWRLQYDIGPYCTEGNVLTANSGAFADGSGANIYKPRTKCSWLIKPEDGREVRLSFTEFNTDRLTDVVHVYDGADANAPLLGKLSGFDLPAPLASTGNALFVTFTTDNSQQRDGWAAEYTSFNVVEAGAAQAWLKVYPNPTADGRLHVSLTGPAHLTVLDATGRTVWQGATTGDDDLDLSALPAGVYALRAMQGERQAAARVVLR